MIKELIAVKNRQHWDIIFDVSLSEGKQLSFPNEVIKIVSETYNLDLNTTFIVEDFEIFAVNANIATVNPGNACKL
jgi:hypothetical protein